MKKSRKVFWEGLRIIRSCTTMKQLNTAWVWLNLARNHMSRTNYFLLYDIADIQLLKINRRLN